MTDGAASQPQKKPYNPTLDKQQSEAASQKKDAGASKPLSLNDVPTPMIVFGVVVIAFIVQMLYGRISRLAEEERTWDPAPKGLSDKQVVILYCSS